MAVANYHANAGCYPPAITLGPDGKPWHSWRVLILPYLDRRDLYQAYNFHQPWNGPGNQKLIAQIPNDLRFHHGAPDNQTVTNYLAVVGPETSWPGAKPIQIERVTDAHATTILIIENRGAGIIWTEPRDLEFKSIDLRFNQPNGIGSPYEKHGVVTLDGTLQLDRHTKPETIRAMLTINGGEQLHQQDTTWQVLNDGRTRAIHQE